ncbi:MAG TPA: DUF1476 domain-containing protein [Micavibrio sp.]
MSSFDNRKDAFESKYAHDQEMMFRAEARCCKLFGLWLAGEMGLAGAEADLYAKEVVSSNLDEAGFDDVKRKVMADIKTKGLDISEHIIDRQLEKSMAEAKAQLLAGK